MSEPPILAIDQGTSGTTCLLVTPGGEVLHRAYREVAIAYPRPGWVEQDAEQLWQSVVETAREVLTRSDVHPAAIGITNQRETVVTFDRTTLEPVAPAIVWQCRRSTELCASHREAGDEAVVRELTGLLLDPYFSGTKLEMLLGEQPDLKRRGRDGELAAGTIDAWLTARLTGGRVFATDASNASRTLLFNIHTGEWDDELCSLFSVPRAMLPDVVDSAGRIAVTDPDSFLGLAIPVCGIAGDQQAALFGQACVARGMSKNTYGTGSFVLANVGETAPQLAHGLLSTVAWRIAGRLTYALEGSIFVTGAGLKWLRDQLGLITRVDEAGPLFDSVPDSNGCFFIPALAGLGAPFWDPDARGALVGLTAGVNRAHVVRAVVEAMAYRTRDVVEAMEAAGGIRFAELRVDGGASVMDGLCQFQSDLLGLPVARAATAETTAAGAAMLAAIGVGMRSGVDEVAAGWRPGRRFEPESPGTRTEASYRDWLEAVGRVRTR